MSKIIITGAKGELSVAVKEYLREKGHDDTNCISVRGDEWRHCSFQGVDSIVHIAGVVPKKDIDSRQFYTVNRDLTIELAIKAKTDGAKQFVYISSMAVYGKEPSLIPSEGTVCFNTPCNPTSDYGKSKLQAEEGIQSLEDENFKIAIIRVPSIYSKTKKEYFSQYQFLIRKFKCIPIAFKYCYRSAIYLDNLCELIRLTVEEKYSGILCPDDGNVSAIDYCTIASPNVRRSKLIGIIVELFLGKHPIIKGMYGTIAYDSTVSNCFGGKYRIVDFDSVEIRMNYVEN
jgi:UDP-glucose 4-epimerase